MRHSSKIINLVGFDGGDQMEQIRGVAKIAIVEKELHARLQIHQIMIRIRR